MNFTVYIFSRRYIERDQNSLIVVVAAADSFAVVDHSMDLFFYSWRRRHKSFTWIPRSHPQFFLFSANISRLFLFFLSHSLKPERKNKIISKSKTIELTINAFKTATWFFFLNLFFFVFIYFLFHHFFDNFFFKRKDCFVIV